MQLAIDNLMLALGKETEQTEQTKIQFVLAKAQHILLNDTFEFDFHIAIQNQNQALQIDFASKTQEIQASIAKLQIVKSTNSTNQSAITESVNQSTTDSSKTATAAATKSTNSYAQAAAQNQNKQSNQNWQLVNNKKKAANAAKNTAAKTESSTYRERRLILLHSRDSEFDSMKTRDQINQELQKQLNLAANKPVLAAIVRSQLHQNVVLTTTK
jgi:hypothetical protein